MGLKVANNAKGQLVSGIDSDDLEFTLKSGEGALFPTLGAGDYCYCTLQKSTGDNEIVKVTDITGDVFTIVRAQDGTTAKAFSADDYVSVRPVRAVITDLQGELVTHAAAMTWTTITTFYNSWQNYGDAYAPAGYGKDIHGFVHLRGMLKLGTVDSSAFILPSGYRPVYRSLFVVITNNLGKLDIQTDGTVTPMSPSGNTFLSLEGISFQAA